MISQKIYTSLLKYVKKGAIFGLASITILIMILEAGSGGRFIKFPAMIIGIYACGIDGYGGFFQDCGSSHAILYFMSIVLFLTIGLLAGVLVSVLLWLFSLMKN